ncbi:MAG: MFS transporter, partial [Candidatus Eremiobacteraeota bacterium]|nr:MFS transporter [Candidatus Eremiobacteraeota bacterium]
ADFNKLWAGQTISLVGSAVTTLALPSVAILVLNAKPAQIGILESAQFLAFPILGLPAGVWVDRVRRRRVMIGADIGRALALASVPLAWVLHALTLVQLYAVACIAGVLTVFFDVAYQSYLPSLIDRRLLVEGNAKLEVSRSGAQVAGNGLAGILIQALGAPLAVLVDSISFVASVVGLAAIKTPEAVSAAAKQAPRFWRQLKDGAAVVFQNPVLREIAACTSTSNLGNAMSSAVYLIFAYRTLHLGPAVVGAVLAFGDFGIAGALWAGPLARRFGLGKTLAACALLFGVASLLPILAFWKFPVFFLFVSQLLISFANPVYNVNQVSLRQTITPDELQGRMNATMRTIVWGTLPVGALIGGALGSAIGVLPTIAIAGTITLSAALFIRFGQVYKLAAAPAST